MKKFIMPLALALVMSIAFAGCSQDEPESVNWISPMVSFNIAGNTASVWNSQYDLHRNETFEYVFLLDGVETPITAAALRSGGAVPATINMSYDGDGEYLTRLVVLHTNFLTTAALKELPRMAAV